jgi:predicted dehydrogenase
MDRQRADTLAQEAGVRGFYELDHLLEQGLNILSVATAGPENGGHHFLPTMRAFTAGTHVICEKPLSNNLSEAKQMVAMAEERGLYLAVDLNHRFTPATRLAKEKQVSGDLGDLLFVKMSLWIRNPNESAPYFHLRALHSHSVDVMQHFGGMVQQVQAFFSKGPGRQIWSNASINLRFGCGALGYLYGSYDVSGLHGIERTEIGGTKGRVVIDNSTVDFHWYPHASKESVHIHQAGGMTSFSETLPARLHRFLEQVAAGVSREELEGSGKDGLQAHAVVEAAIRSHETGKAVDVQELIARA